MTVVGAMNNMAEMMSLILLLMRPTWLDYFYWLSANKSVLMLLFLVGANIILCKLQLYVNDVAQVHTHC